MKLSDFIKKNIDLYQIEYRVHATRRMFQRNISEDEVEFVLVHGEIIENYTDDFPLPSVLVNGCTPAKNRLHLVVGINDSEKIIVVITAYNPSEEKWDMNFSRRKTK
ncbi:MAG: hypothetical protein BM485_16815 [Desulfobulbaceae bacterium DB1]|nr:MAG: hypothetical protein BM485_16815 [Desulfobulbaceae bacterium DB1]